MNKSSKVVEEIEELLNKYERLFIENVNPSRKDDERFIRAYFFTCIEYAQGICELIKKDNLISVEPLFRSLLETIVDIANLCIYQDYYLYLRREELKQSQKRYEKWHKEKENEFFPNVDEIDDEFKKSVKRVKEEIKEINKGGFFFLKDNSRSLEIREKFDLAKILKVHSSIWDLISSAIHNDLPTIKKRHFKIKKNGEIEVTKKGKFTIEDLTPHLLTIPGLLYSAVGEVFERFGINKKEIEDIYKEKIRVLKNVLNADENER